MRTLKKANLAEVNAAGTVSRGVDVQFNPTTLRLQMNNSIDTGKSKGRQTWRYNGTSSTTLTVELEFDSADEGTPLLPSDVRAKTAMVRRFMLPKEKSTDAPPSVRFHWGTFVLTGVMTSASEDLDLFTAEGTPLRAKMTISIKEQDPRFAVPPSPPAVAAAAAVAAIAGRLPPAGPGGRGVPAGAADRVAEALDGESAADFLARNGLPPDAWRAVANPLGDALNLAAGELVGFSADLAVGLSLGLGGGQTAGGGFAASVSPDAQARLGLDGEDDAAGLALSAAGGLSAAVQTQAAATAAATAQASRSAFAAPGAPAQGSREGGAPAGTSRSTQPVRPVADPRASSFGLSIPLRGTVVPAELSGTNAAWTTIAARSPATPAAGRGRRCGCTCGAGCGCASEGGR